MRLFDMFKRKNNAEPKLEIRFEEELNPILQSEISLKQTLKSEQADREKTKKLSKNLTNEEKNFINEFICQAKTYSRGNKIIYNFRGGNINFEIKGMQIGRISLNEKNRTMQILTRNDVKWITPITYDEALNNIDKWIDYMKWLLDDN